MFSSLAFQALIVPLLLSFVLYFFSQKNEFIHRKKTPISILLWIGVYTWIVNFPNFPPRLILDWLGIVILLLAISYFFLRLQLFWAQCYLFLISLGFVVISTWPVISYDATLTSHWLIWLEICCFFIIFNFVVHRHLIISSSHQNISYFNVAFIFCALGGITIINGSLILGILMLAYGFLLGSPALRELFCQDSHKYDVNASLHLIIFFYFALMSRIYADVPFFIITILCFAFTYSVFKFPSNTAQKYVASFIGILLLVGSAWYEYISQMNTHSYY